MRHATAPAAPPAGRQRQPPCSSAAMRYSIALMVGGTQHLPRRRRKVSSASRRPEERAQLARALDISPSAAASDASGVASRSPRRSFSWSTVLTARTDPARRQPGLGGCSSSHMCCRGVNILRKANVSTVNAQDGACRGSSRVVWRGVHLKTCSSCGALSVPAPCSSTAVRAATGPTAT
jgi:hypothetical protein